MTSLHGKLSTNTDKLWDYEEYYVGDKDNIERRQGQGEICWSGAKSLESYNGQFNADTMHGIGTYCWKFYAGVGAFYTYEGYFYVNKKQGYGTTSFPDGRVFDGLYRDDKRWGPGIETITNLRQNVGLWRGSQLIRLTWCPEGLSPIPDFLSVPHGRLAVQSHRKVLKEHVRNIPTEVNKAQELLKQCKCDPTKISKLWRKLYPVHCTDIKSQLCHVESFEKQYYGNNIRSLKEIQDCDDVLSINSSFDEEMEGEDEYIAPPKLEIKKFYAWNNSDIILKLMKYCYTNHEQQKPLRLDLSKVLVGPRSHFQPAGNHEKCCRALLMSSYIGNVEQVTRLVNEFCAHQNVTDCHGNNPVMYATCGDHTQIIHFLVQSSSNVDYMNDSCCTPLGVALMRMVCASAGVPFNAILQALLPPPTNFQTNDDTTKEWIINRENYETARVSILGKQRKDSILKPTVEDADTYNIWHPVESTEDSIGKNYENISSLYNSKILNLVQTNSTASNISYIFHAHNMLQDVDFGDEVVLKKVGTKESASKVSRADKNKSTKVTEADLQQSAELATASPAKILQTIKQLLCDGANPNLVIFPQPALVMAVAAKCPDLLKDLIDHGVNINESFPNTFNYTSLDLAISQPFTSENVELIRVLLESGAECNHRLKYTQYDQNLASEIEIPGPNLLHMVLGRKIDLEDSEQEERRIMVLQLLLEHNCDPLTQFKGQSPLDVAMSRNKNQLNAFIINTSTNLNGVINSCNQTALVKMFTIPYFKTLEPSNRLQILADLVLHGANPLMKCQNMDEIYDNLLVFINSIIGSSKLHKESNTSLVEKDKNSDKDKKKGDNGKTPNKAKKGDKGKQSDKVKHDKLKTQSKTRYGLSSTDDLREYSLALELVKEYARMLQIRWLQASLMTELAEIIYKFKHRTWNMIIKEHKRRFPVSLWLTSDRCIEIWEIMSTTKKNIYQNPLVLKYLLYIVEFYNIASTLHKLRSPYMSAIEKSQVESHIDAVLREYRKEKKYDLFKSFKNNFSLPELSLKNSAIFNVCFDCSLPLTETNILCENCNVVYFCDMKCMIQNIDRPDCHPCNELLRMKYMLPIGE